MPNEINNLIKVLGIHLSPDNEILLLKKDDKWDLPGGAFRPEESDVDCLVRTITEEQLPYCTLQIGEIFNIFYGKTFEDRERTAVYWVVLKGDLSINPGIKEEIKEAKLFSLEELLLSKIHNEISETTSRVITRLIGKGVFSLT